jgi:hypothetical protein
VVAAGFSEAQLVSSAATQAVAAVTRNRCALRERQAAVDGIYSLPVAGGPDGACR